MNKSNKLTAATLLALGVVFAGSGVVVADEMMKSAPMMDKKMEMMDKSMDKGMMMSHEVPFSAETFMKAQAGGQPFLVAFHKKGCPMCASQKDALKQIYANPDFKDLMVLVVDYDNDTASLKKFNVGMQATLVLYKGDMEVRRGNGLVKAMDIESLVRG